MADPLDPLAGPVVANKAADVLSQIPVGEADYRHTDQTIRGLSSLPGLTETILPSIKALLMPGKDNPYGAMIDRSTQGNVASAQTEAMKRGLTGSDIEASSMNAERTAGENQKTAFYTQNATQMANFMKDLATGDISSQRENLMMFAQLMGQKITSDNDLAMFREQLQANLGMADKANKTALWGAGIGAAGAALGGLASAAKFSDERLKVGLKKVGRAAGVDIFSFRWNIVARAFGAHDRVEFGVLAQDVAREYPSAVGEKNGWKTVDYTRMPVAVFDEVNRLEAASA